MVAEKISAANGMWHYFQKIGNGERQGRVYGFCNCGEGLAVTLPWSSTISEISDIAGASKAEFETERQNT